MTKHSVTLATVTLVVTFASGAQAYSTDPAPCALHQITQLSPAALQPAQVAGACTVEITPRLAEILALPDSWEKGGQLSMQTAVACEK